MIKLELTNCHVAIRGASRAQIRSLESATSYKVAGAYFTEAFRAKRWDGKEHLLTYSEKHGYRAPIGLLEDILCVLDEQKTVYRIIDNRIIYGNRRQLNFNPDIVLRPYQKEAHRSILRESKGKALFGSGLLKMPIRSGKTKTAAAYISSVGLRTLVVVPSQMLLHQTVKALSESFPDESIGVIGDGEYDLQFITVSTIQTLHRWRNRMVPTGKKVKNEKGELVDKMKRVPDGRFILICNITDVCVIDEAHHLRGDSDWHKVVSDIKSRFKCALSATAYLDNKTEQGRGIIWLKACTGPMRIDIPESRLIREGYLMTQTVRLLKVSKPSKFQTWKWSVSLQRDAIWYNEHRNLMIVGMARTLIDKGYKTLIVLNRLEHMDCLSQMLWDARINHEIVSGRDGKRKRAEKVDDFVSGVFHLLIGTVFAEGVDIPEIEAVIVAAGGRDVKVTMQRMRNMTIKEGKKRALLFDFIDEHNPYLLEHSKERLKVYESIPEFKVKIVE